jgi:hypothetical protein
MKGKRVCIFSTIGEVFSARKYVSKMCFNNEVQEHEVSYLF